MLALLILAVTSCSSGGAPATTAPATTTTVSAITTASTTTEAVGDWRLEALTAAAADYGSRGALAVVLDGESRWAGAVGIADSSGTPAEVNMRFRAGSITKTVVATIALLRSEDGNLDLDAPVDALLPGWLNEPAVTTRQLLQHTAGIFDLGNEGDPMAALAAIPDPVIAEEALGLVDLWERGGLVAMPAWIMVLAAETQPRYFEPGTGYHYSNMGYQVVGVVLEQVSSGLHLGVLVEQRLVIPHDLESMSMAPWDTTSPELRGLDISYQEAIDTTDDLLTFGNGGNGGLLTTADDLAVFFRLLLRGEIVSPAGVETMLSPSEASVALGIPYGLGIATYSLGCGTFYGHGGSVNGTIAIALADRTGERVAIVAFNTRRSTDPSLVDLAETLLCG